MAFSTNSTQITSPFVRKRSRRRLPSTPTSTSSTPCTHRTYSARPRIHSGYSLHPNDERDLWDDDTDVFINVQEDRNYNGHRNLLAVRSADLTSRNDSDQEMHQPLRSQSFKHRSRPFFEMRRYPLEDISQERRKSTPNVSRRCSLTQRNRADTARTDVWPEAKTTSEAEERFLKLPDSEDYKRVRQFKIDEKGAVVSRGDSFRRKRMNNTVCEGNSSPCPLPSYESEGQHEEYQSRSTSLSSNNDSIREQQPPSTSQGSFKIYVLGATGTGKSALVSQFMTSECRNPFATEADSSENTVSINIGGQESELTFYEADPQNDDSWIDREVHLYLLLYSIDSRTSFKQAIYVVERLRESASTRHMPIVMAGNKVDLERKRTVSKADAKNMALTFGFVHYEISVALNHDVDDLLVGLIAEIKESINPQREHTDIENQQATLQTTDQTTLKTQDHSDFKAAIRRFSQRKKKQMGVEVEAETNKCSHLKPSNLIDRFRNWRISLPKLTQ